MATPTISAVAYDVHPSVAMVRSWIEALPEKTGRSLESWVELVRTTGPTTEKERREWLKREHGLGTNTAWWIAERADGKGWEDGDPETYLRAAAGYVEQMFSGKRAALRPLFDRLLGLARSLGEDVRVCPCQTIVPLYRRHVFAQLKPATNTRIDVGFALKGATDLPSRLIDTGGEAKGDRITHRIPVTRLEEVDEELVHWLRTAYGRDAG